MAVEPKISDRLSKKDLVTIPVAEECCGKETRRSSAQALSTSRCCGRAPSAWTPVDAVKIQELVSAGISKMSENGAA